VANHVRTERIGKVAIARQLGKDDDTFPNSLYHETSKTVQGTKP
jgi:hypothetical protein